MKIAFVASETSSLAYAQEKICRIVNESFPNAEIAFFLRKDQTDNLNEIKEFAPELMVTWNLEGFEMCTIMDAIAYNLLHCRQLHLLPGTGWDTEENRKILRKQLSLTMFFYCGDEEQKRRLTEINPDVPFLEINPSLMAEEGVWETLPKMISSVMEN
ncbi:MAG: hypothetical protein K5891_02625 [Lachnospiraceae bacterium]|nr:hypothetical protein [Lachnospiraceae bacterium]